MNKIFITGAGGFVGTNIILNSKNSFIFYKYSYRKEDKIFIDNDIDIVMHFAGKSHDLFNESSTNLFYEINTNFTKKIFDAFLLSNAKIFITLSSVKAVGDTLSSELTELTIPNPLTHYGISKLLADEYILSKTIPKDKRVYILRPCMIHGPGNKGNLNLLYNIVSKGFPWPLGAFDNKRSFCSIDNLSFVLNELIKNDSIHSGVYNIADDEPIATNDLIKLIAGSQGKKYRIWKIPAFLINKISKIGDIIKLPLNTLRLNKLTETYIVSNNKIKNAINKPLPFSAKEGLIKTLNSFKTNVK